MKADKDAMYAGYCISNGISKWDAKNNQKAIKDTYSYASYELKYAIRCLIVSILETCVKAYEENREAMIAMEGEYH